MTREMDEKISKIRGRLYYFEKRLAALEEAQCNKEQPSAHDCHVCSGKGYWIGANPAEKRAYKCSYCEAGDKWETELGQ
jgi:hypothetical protein